MIVPDKKSEIKRYSTIISTQLKHLHTISRTLKPEFADYLDERVHNDSIFCALFGLGDKIICSDYLHSKWSDRGLQFQVKEHSLHYQDLEEHFNKHWKNSYIALYFVYYNFCKIHTSLSITPAMQAGLTKKPMPIEDIANLAPIETPKKRGSFKKTIH